GRNHLSKLSTYARRVTTETAFNPVFDLCTCDLKCAPLYRSKLIANRGWSYGPGRLVHRRGCAEPQSARRVAARRGQPAFHADPRQQERAALSLLHLRGADHRREEHGADWPPYPG